MAVQLVHTGVELYDFYPLRNEKKTLKFVLKKLIESTTTNQPFLLVNIKGKNEIFIYEDVS